MEYSKTMPVQYQEGKAGFLGMDVMVDERVFIPRPETELLVKVVSEFCLGAGREEANILELCTGSGVIPLGLVKLMGNCRVTAADISEDALNVAEENLKLFDSRKRVTLVRSDMFSAFESKNEGTFDAVVSNPPYVSESDYESLDAWVKTEPKIALSAGAEGMDYLYVIARESSRFLKPGGLLAVEIGYDQANKVASAFNKCGFRNVTSFRDLGGHERVITGEWHG